MRVFARILATMTAAATAFGLMAVYLHFAELKASYRKYKRWKNEELEGEKW